VRWGGPFDPKADGIFTAATLHGLESREMKLLTIIDTGTQITIIDEDLATFIGLDKSQSIGPVSFDGLTHPVEGYRVLVPRFEVFGRVLKGFEVACCPMSNSLGPRCPDQFSDGPFHPIERGCQF
jgi:hypothetical protein